MGEGRDLGEERTSVVMINALERKSLTSRGRTPGRQMWVKSGLLDRLDESKHHNFIMNGGLRRNNVAIRQINRQTDGAD